MTSPSEWVAVQTMEEFEDLDRAWVALEVRCAAQDAVVVEEWLDEIAILTRLEEQLRSQGTWISGPRDLMGVLEIAFDEVRHCRVLRWLLDPSGGHGMGDGFLRGFASDISKRASVDLDISPSFKGVSVVVEEARGATRADIVVRTDAWALLVEAKIFAGEQPNQGTRLETLWSAEEPLLVFLTRSGRPMKTGSERWMTYTWRDVARCLRRSLDATDSNSFSTVREYLKTLEAYFR